MEAKRKRTPLSDCTNTTTTTFPSIEKPYAHPSVASAIKTLLNSIDGKNIINSNSEPSEDNYDVADRIASTPATSLLVAGTSGKFELAEPCSVYSRRKTADKRKSKGKTLAVPSTGSLKDNTNTAGDRNKEDGATAMSRSCRTHKRKKKKQDPQHAMTQDFIERQRAYFAEIDAFELSEEEVESADQLE